MGGFDITNMRGRSSFADSIKKRKALGLDSDSDDEKPRKTVRKPVVNKTAEAKEALKPIEVNTIEKPVEKPIELDPSFMQMQETTKATDRYIEEAEALLLKPMRTFPTEPVELKPKSPVPTHQDSFNSAIELSDEEEETVRRTENDIEDLDPELAAILKQSSVTKHHEPLKVTVKLQYVHNFKDLKDNTRAIVDQLVKPIKIRILDCDQFHTALNAFCKKKNLKKSDVVLTYKDNLVFLSGTPAGIGMTEVGTHQMQVYPLKCYQEMQEEKQMRRMEMRKKYSIDYLDQDDFSSLPTQPSQPEEDNRILLKLRNKDKSEISLKVKPTTLLSSLVSSYQKHANISSPVQLSFEGETLDLKLQVSETELEDEDLIEVIVTE